MARVGAPGLGDTARALEALATLTAASAVRRTLRASTWHPILGEPAAVPADAVPTVPATGAEGDVASAISRAARRLPWHTTCLDRALAGQLMLRARRRPGTTVIGLRPGERWAAHAWLVGRTGVLLGMDGGAECTPVSAFRPRGS